MPTISQLPVATEVAADDLLPLSQGDVSRAVTAATLLQNTQTLLTLPHNALLGRASLGPGGPESIALGTGLQIQNDVLLVDHSSYPLTQTLSADNQLLLNDTTGTPALMPISLLRGLYTAGQNVTIDPNGTIHSTPVPATGGSIGAVAVGNALVINASGQLSVNIGSVSGTAAAGDDTRITHAEQTTNKNSANGYAGIDATGFIPIAILPPGGTSPVQTVAGRIGNIVLTTADVGGLGSIATQSSAAVSVSGGTISGANVSASNATASLSGAVTRGLASHFADTVSVNDFGLARDGITDDSAKFITACQTAISRNLKLYIPAGGPILLTDAAQQNLANLCIFGDAVRDYSGAQGYGHVGSQLWFTGRTKSPFLLGPNVQFKGINFFWPNQTEVGTVSNGNLPLTYPPLFAQQVSPLNITYFNFVDCQVTNCYDFFTALGTVAVVGACVVDRCIIYAIRNCFTLQNVPEVFFISNTLFTWGVYGSVVAVGPTFNLRSYTNTQGTWLKVVGDGTVGAVATSTVGGIMSSNNYVFGSSRGIWLAAGTLDVSNFVNTGFDNIPTVLQGDPGCAIFSTRFTGGVWYPIYYNQAGNPDVTAIRINNPAANGTGCNVTFSGITVPFINGSFVSITGSALSSLSFSDIRCNALGHTSGGAGPYYAFQINAPNANVRIASCDFQASNASLSNTGVQITACANAAISDCYFRNFTAPIDIETTAAPVSLSGNTSVATQGAGSVIGLGTNNVHDLANNWDKAAFAYNGFAPNSYRPGATIGIQPVSCTATAGYVGIQPSATGSGGGTRFGVTSFGAGPVSLLTNAFNEEQLRVNRQVGAVNYVAVRGSVSGSPSLITSNGADTSASIQITGSANGTTQLGSVGPSGSVVVHLGASADQSYVGSIPVNGFSITVPLNCSTLLLKPAGALSTGNVILPAAITDGEKIDIWTSKTITALTVTSNAGAVVNNGVAFQLSANASVRFFWIAPNNTWFQGLGSGSTNGSISQQNADNVAITGGSITGLSAFSVGSDVSVAANVVIDTAPGYARQLVYASASLPRWVVGVQGTANSTLTETTSFVAHVGDTFIPLTSTAGLAPGMPAAGTNIPVNTNIASLTAAGVTLSQPVTGFIGTGVTITFGLNSGEDFAILPYNDSGSPLAPYLGQPLLITRATGQVTIGTLALTSSGSAPTPAAGDSSTQLATTAFVGAAIGSTAVLTSRIGAPNGVAALDAGGKVPSAQLPASVQGALNYQGTWNAATNVPPLASGAGTKGFYYTVAVTGATALDGITQWNAGDHAAFNGTNWEKLDGLASEVISVAGRTGTVTLTNTDIAGLGSIATQAANSVALTGGTITGLSALGVGVNAGGLVTVSLNAASATPRQVTYQTNGVARWNLLAQADAEAATLVLNTTAASNTTLLTFASTTGAGIGMSVGGVGITPGTLVTALTGTTITLSVAASGVVAGAAISFYPNTGTSFALRSYDDGGNLLTTPLSIARSTGALGILGTVATSGFAPIVVQGGAAVLGSARGLGAFDGQQYRTTAAQVASGQYAAMFGNGNTASGLASFSAGAGNTIAGSYSHGFGGQARDFGRYGGAAMASGANSVAGDAQRFEGVLRAAAAAATATRLTADGAAAGAANVFNLQNNQLAKLNIEIIGCNAANVAATSWFARDVLLARGASAATTTLSSTTLSAGGTVGTVTGWTAPTIAADVANGGLTIFSGFGPSLATKWVARVVSIELM